MLTLVGSDVGINVSSPVVPLEVGGPSTHGVPTIRVDGNGDILLGAQGGVFFDGDYNYALGSYIGPYSYTSGTYDANTQKFSTAGVERMRITSAGYVGIGTTSPSYPLYVYGTAYASAAAGALSDIRHKDHVVSLPAGALQTVEQLRPVTFTWKKPTDDGTPPAGAALMAGDRR